MPDGDGQQALAAGQVVATPGRGSKQGGRIVGDEHVFLSEGNIYISNTKVVLYGTTYATANITSVTKRFTPPSKGCAITLVVFGVLAVLAMLGSFKAAEAGQGIGAIIVAALILGAGILWLRALKPTYHVVLASASGEREGLSSKDNSLVDRVVAAITDAITHRG
jgi:RsiW-degrading membrane proteinase PrsW (M82 family)